MTVAVTNTTGISLDSVRYVAPGGVVLVDSIFASFCVRLDPYDRESRQRDHTQSCNEKALHIASHGSVVTVK